MWSRSVPRPHRRPPGSARSSRRRAGPTGRRGAVRPRRCRRPACVPPRRRQRGRRRTNPAAPPVRRRGHARRARRRRRDRPRRDRGSAAAGRTCRPPGWRRRAPARRAGHAGPAAGERLPVHVDDVGAPDDAVRFGARDGPLVRVNQLGLRGHERCGAEESACGGGPEGDAAGGGDHGAGDGGADELHGVHPARVTCACGPAHSGTGGAVPAGTAPPVRRAAGPRPARRRASPARSGRSRRAPCSSAGPS